MTPKIPLPETDHDTIDRSKKDWMPKDADPDADENHELPRDERKEPQSTPLPPD